MELRLETKSQGDATLRRGTEGGGEVMLTPKIEESYWTFRVQVAETGQAIVGFPKFSTIGIGFEHEEDWNSNLPYGCPALDILNHVWHNAGPGVDPRDALRAIKMVQAAATERLGPKQLSSIRDDLPQELWPEVKPGLEELFAEEAKETEVHGSEPA